MTVDFDPTDDFAAASDGARPVTLVRPGTSMAVAIGRALALGLERREAEASLGLYTETDVVWHFGAAGAETPEPGDLLVEPDGRRWTVLSVASQTAATRWRCVCRELALVQGLDRYVDIEKAAHVKGQHGALVPRWQTWRTGVPARIQPVAAQPDQAAGQDVTAATYVVYLDCAETLDPTHRLRTPDGTLLRVLACRKADRIDALLEVQATAFEPGGVPNHES